MMIRALAYSETTGDLRLGEVGGLNLLVQARFAPATMYCG